MILVLIICLFLTNFFFVFWGCDGGNKIMDLKEQLGHKSHTLYDLKVGYICEQLLNPCLVIILWAQKGFCVPCLIDM